eukprot:GILI01027247.1.p1 GENE.GILI01027247.1~~GILI01027247.1.p1  ORF type:complete len:102 (-),score=25.92 GILI01027247.1:337-642(-)
MKHKDAIKIVDFSSPSRTLLPQLQAQSHPLSTPTTLSSSSGQVTPTKRFDSSSPSIPPSPSCPSSSSINSSFSSSTHPTSFTSSSSSSSSSSHHSSSSAFP